MEYRKLRTLVFRPFAATSAKSRSNSRARSSRKGSGRSSSIVSRTRKPSGSPTSSRSSASTEVSPISSSPRPQRRARARARHPRVLRELTRHARAVPGRGRIALSCELAKSARARGAPRARAPSRARRKGRGARTRSRDRARTPQTTARTPSRWRRSRRGAPIRARSTRGRRRAARTQTVELRRDRAQSFRSRRRSSTLRKLIWTGITPVSRCLPHHELERKRKPSAPTSTQSGSSRPIRAPKSDRETSTVPTQDRRHHGYEEWRPARGVREEARCRERAAASSGDHDVGERSKARASDGTAWHAALRRAPTRLQQRRTGPPRRRRDPECPEKRVGTQRRGSWLTF